MFIPKLSKKNSFGHIPSTIVFPGNTPLNSSVCILNFPLLFPIITISSDYRAMTTYAKSIVNEMKDLKENQEDKTY